MILILLYWFGLFIAFSIAGLGVQRLFQIKELHPILVPIIGSFGITLAAGIWAFALPLNYLFDISLLIIVIGISFYSKFSIKQYLHSLKKLFYTFTPFLKTLLGLIILLAAIKTAGVPSIVDNESYYIQTIKWLDTYGWVHGLGNLHPFLAQQSGWHLLHAAVNLNNLKIYFNDINGLYLIFANIYAFGYLSEYVRSRENTKLIIGLFPLFNIFLFQFIDSPSPDLGVYILGYFVFAEYLKRNESTPSSSFLLLSLLVIWSVFIKGTAIFLIVFPLAFLLKNKSLIRRSIVLKSMLTGVFVALIFFGKNIWVSGLPLFPLDVLAVEVPWRLSDIIMNFLNDQMQPAGYKMTAEQISNASFLEMFKHWLLLPKLAGLFNITITLLLITFPFAIKKVKDSNASFLLFLTTLLQMLLLWSTSPQYRFFFGLLMLLFLVILSKVVRHKNIIYPMLSIVWAGILAVIFLPSLVGKLNTNTLQLQQQGFQITQLWKPGPNTQHQDVDYSEEKIKNLHYYDPQNLEFFWGTGDGPLPCVQKEQLEYFETYYKILPQQLGEHINEGFYTEELE